MKKNVVIITFIFLLSIMMFGCSDNRDAEKEKVVAEVESADTMEIIDMLGRKVEVPSTINTIATPNVDAYRILVQLGAQDKLIGAPSNMYNSKYSEADTIEVLAWPEVKNADKVGGGPPNTEINVESLIKLNPDVIISWSYGDSETGISQADLLQQKTQIPVLCLNSITQTDNSLKNIEDAYEMMGTVSGKKDRADDLISYYETEVEKVKNVIEEKVSEPARFYMCSPGNILRATNSYLPPKQLGLTNVAYEIGEKGGDITKEHLIGWNPDYIFMHTPSKVYRVNREELMADSVLKSVSAIENNQVYHIKANYMGWDIATGLVDTYIIAKVVYPEIFEDIDMDKKGEEILKTFYSTEGLYKKLKENSDLPSFNN